jgi:hypothetical protein
MEQSYGVRDARDEPAQAGEQQQFFDLPDHDVLPRRVPEIPITRSGNLGSTRGLDSIKKRGIPRVEPSIAGPLRGKPLLAPMMRSVATASCSSAELV